MTFINRHLVVSIFFASIFIFNPHICSAENESLLEQLVERLEKLEKENAQLKEVVNRLIKSQDSDLSDKHERKQKSKHFKLQTNSQYSFEMLDHTKSVNQKQKKILEYKQSGRIDNGVIIGGSVTPIIDYQKSNTDSKFGYLMRHPTSANQLGKNVSEAVIHSAELNFTANLSNWLTAYTEFLYDPEQSFGQGTITSLGRNQIQLRKGYLLYGDLEKSPFYAAVGKMAVAFGLNDTVSPFTSSTVWHAFGGLAYSALMGYSYKGWNISLDAIQGGAQFRAANVPVQGTSTPSRLNNVAVDINYTKSFNSKDEMLVGASFIKGSAYCQNFPVVHFENCSDHNPAYSLYARLDKGKLLYQLEYAETLNEWPGTFNPNPPLNRFIASKVTSMQAGLIRQMDWNSKKVDMSLEFSRFKSGPSSSPWEKQDQWVFGLSHHLTDSVKLFGELIRVTGFAPLNFISGGHIPNQPNVTHSDRDAQSTVLLLGADAAF